MIIITINKYNHVNKKILNTNILSNITCYCHQICIHF